MIKSFKGKTPVVPDSAFVADSALVIGDVVLGENVNVWYGAVIRGDEGKIIIGDNTNVQDNCVVHCDEDLIIGKNVKKPILKILVCLGFTVAGFVVGFFIAFAIIGASLL